MKIRFFLGSFRHFRDIPLSFTQLQRDDIFTSDDNGNSQH